MTHPKMLAWQYKVTLSGLSLLQEHAADPTCPCSQFSIGEWCMPKHALHIAGLAAETAAMDEPHADMWFDLQSESNDLHEKLKKMVCGHGKSEDIVSWARAWRKRIEPIYYACDVKAKPAHLHADVLATFPVCATASLHAPAASPAVKVVGSCGADKQCSFKVTATKKAEAHVSTCKSLPKAVEDVIQRALAGTSKAAPAVTDKTFAMGITTSTRYEFRHKIVEGVDLIVSNDPFTFARNPAYERTIQPRERGRAATQLQVENIAANLTPDLLLLDFLSIDKGSPIVGEYA